MHKGLIQELEDVRGEFVNSHVALGDELSRIYRRQEIIAKECAELRSILMGETEPQEVKPEDQAMAAPAPSQRQDFDSPKQRKQFYFDSIRQAQEELLNAYGVQTSFSVIEASPPPRRGRLRLAKRPKKPARRTKRRNW